MKKEIASRDVQLKKLINVFIKMKQQMELASILQNQGKPIDFAGMKRTLQLF